MPVSDTFVVETFVVAPPPAPPDTARSWALVAPASPVGYTSKIYSTIGEMADDGWTNAYVAYNAMARLFEQEPTERQLSAVLVVARATPVAQVWQIDINSVADGDHTISIGGVLAATFTASSNTAEDIKLGLIAAFNLGPFATKQLAGSVDIDSLSLTAIVAGIPFVPTVAVPSGTIHDVTETTPNTGVYDDLEAAHAARKFRNVMMPAALDVELDEGRRWVQADTTTRRCFLWAENADPAVYDSGDTDNLAYEWRVAQHPRVTLLSHPLATDYMMAAAAGRLGASYPGARAWHYLPLAGSTETAISANRTADQTATMADRRMLYTERYFGPTSDLLLLSPEPNIPSGQFVFQRWAEDHLWYTARATIDAAMKANAGVNLNDAGLQTLCDTLGADLVQLFNAGVIDSDYTVTYVPLDQIPAGELAVGDFKTTGAIIVSATVTPKLRKLRVTAYLAVV